VGGVWIGDYFGEAGVAGEWGMEMVANTISIS